MTDQSIYETIAGRAGGDIFIGVVGPVRTGKSTFIRRFLGEAILPQIEDEYEKERTKDEIPQSGSGKTVMTTEPKFVPDEGVKIPVGAATCNIRMIDCVGYMVEGAFGGEDEGVERQVMTPWAEEAMAFSDAAELGTRKVIADHATVGVLVTTDGSFTGIPRENYEKPEESVVSELKAAGLPFVIVLNTENPADEAAQSLASDLETRYGVPVALISCLNLDAQDATEILGLLLDEFPVRELTFTPPCWFSALPEGHPLLRETEEKIETFSAAVRKLGDIPTALGKTEGVSRVSVDAGSGTAVFDLPISREKTYETLSELTGLAIRDEETLFRTVLDLAKTGKKYAEIASALSDAETKGYGIVMPREDSIELYEPTLVRRSGGYGVKVSARAETIHMIKTGIKADFCPLIGSEQQSEEVLKHLTEEYEESPAQMLRCDMFGKTLYDLVSDGMTEKLSRMPGESREKLGETLERIVDEGSNGLICILL